jgi:parallel beta-helix repeat protein
VASDCRVVNNSCDQNSLTAGDTGILVTGAGNQIDGNTVTDQSIGIDCNPATGNIIIRNTASGNTTDYSIAAANSAGPILIGANPIASVNPWANFSF